MKEAALQTKGLESSSRFSPRFEKVGECLYRESTYGKYYALVKVNGKQIRTSLKTTNILEARRKLRDHRKELTQVDPTLAKATVAELCERYVQSVGQQTAACRHKSLFCRRRQKSNRRRLRPPEIAALHKPVISSAFYYDSD